MKITAFGSYTFPTVEPRDDFGGLEAISPMMNTPWGAVDTLRGETLDFGPETLVKEFDLIAATPSALATALDIVRALRGKRDILYITPYSGTARWSYARCMAVRYSRTRRNFNAQRVMLRFLVEQNLWNGTSQDTSASKATGATVVMTNNGNANVDDLRIEITAPAGNSVSAIRITCTNPVLDVLVSTTIDATKKLILDSGLWSLNNDGGDVYDDLALQAGHSVPGLFRLLPGANTYTITFTGAGSVSFRYLFNDKFR